MRWRRLLISSLLLCLACWAFCSAGDTPDPASMTEQEIYAELGSLLDRQLTQSLTRQESLQSLQTELETSQMQLKGLQDQLTALQAGSNQLKDSLRSLSLQLSRTAQGLSESSSSLMSLSEDIEREMRRSRIREAASLGIAGVILGLAAAILIMRI